MEKAKIELDLGFEQVLKQIAEIEENERKFKGLMDKNLLFPWER